MKKRSASEVIGSPDAKKIRRNPLTREEVFQAVQLAVSRIRSDIRREIATIVFVEGFDNYHSFEDLRGLTGRMHNELWREFKDFSDANPNLMKTIEPIFQSQDPFPLDTLSTLTLRNWKKTFSKEIKNIRISKENRAKIRITAVLSLKGFAKLLDIQLPMDIIKEIVSYC